MAGFDQSKADKINQLAKENPDYDLNTLAFLADVPASDVDNYTINTNAAPENNANYGKATGDGLPADGSVGTVETGEKKYDWSNYEGDDLGTYNEDFANPEAIGNTSYPYDLSSDDDILDDEYTSYTPIKNTNNNSTVKAENTSLGSEKSGQTTAPTKERVAIPNLLHGMSSYTYNMALYLLTADDYNNFANDPDYSIETQPERLLIKTGGGDYANRNPYFNLDYFIDDLEIDSVISPGGYNKGSINTNVTFKIREPYGMTLLNSFVMAANHFGCFNYIDQPYLLKVWMTGYDHRGQYIGTKNLGQRTRYIPLRLTDFKFGVTEAGTTYDVTAVPFNSMGLLSTKNKVPTDVQIEAKTVDDIFNVAVKIDQQTGVRQVGPPNVNEPIIEKVTEKGLTGYLNKLEDEHVKKKLKGVPDIYAFAIDPEIAKSKINIQEAIDLSKTKNDKDPSKQAQSQFLSNFVFDETTKTYSIRAGTSITDVIHSIMRTTEYMTNQVISADLKKSSEATEEYEETEDQPVKFYRIVPEIKLGPFDKIRNQYAKFITYYIKPYEMTGKDFENLGKKPVEFIAKHYDYFYTGKNTDILSFDIQFNAAYFQTYTYNKMKKAGSIPTSMAETNIESLHEGQTAKSGNDPITKWTPYIREVITQTKTSKDINDPQSDHKSMAIDNFMQEVFDQGADLLSMNMRIIGDMSYLQSKDMRSIALNQKEDFYLPDGSLNTDKEWHIFVRFRNPTDVDARTGLMKGFNINVDGNADINTPSINGQYKIIKVTSNFSGGQFTQNLECIRERNQELNILKEADKKKAVNERDNKDAENTKTTTPSNSGTQLTSTQRNAISSMNGYEPDDFEYTPDKYMSSDERGQLPDATVDLGNNVEAIGVEDWTPNPETVVTPSTNTGGTTDDFLNDQPQKETVASVNVRYDEVRGTYRAYNPVSNTFQNFSNIAEAEAYGRGEGTST